jgi:hypothetical protein
MIHQLVLVCWRVVPQTISFYNPEPSYTRSSLMAYTKRCRDVAALPKRGWDVAALLHYQDVAALLHYQDVATLLHCRNVVVLLHFWDVAALLHFRDVVALPRRGYTAAMLKHGSTVETNLCTLLLCCRIQAMTLSPLQATSSKWSRFVKIPLVEPINQVLGMN